MITQYPFNRPASPGTTGVLPALERGPSEQSVLAMVKVALSSLEMKHLVKQRPGKMFVRSQ